MDTAFLSYLMIVTSVVMIIALLFLPAPYVRYSSSKWGFLVEARLAWFIQELPSFVVPLLCLLYVDDSVRNGNRRINYILMSLYLLHYFHRCLIYPLIAIVKGKSNPISVVLMAWSYCLYNGFLQGRYLLLEASYPSNWFSNYTSIAGVLLFFCWYDNQHPFRLYSSKSS